MGDVYKGIDFERMLSDLGAALERNKAEPGQLPVTQYPKPQPQNVDGIPTARFADVPAEVLNAPQPSMGVTGGAVPPMTPDQQNTSAQLDAVQTQGAGGVPFGHSPAPQMSLQDQQTLAELNAVTPGAVAFGGGYAPHPSHVPPPAVAAQLAGVANQPTAMSAPPTLYPSINPEQDGGLAAYSAMQARR